MSETDYKAPISEYCDQLISLSMDLAQASVKPENKDKAIALIAYKVVRLGETLRREHG